MFCRVCGSQLGPNSKFCMKCGAKNEPTNDRSANEGPSDNKKKDFYATYSQTYKQVFARASFMFRGEQDIDEVVRQVYVATYNNLEKMDSKDNLYVWLRAVTYLYGVNVFQQKGSKPPLSQERDEFQNFFGDGQATTNQVNWLVVDAIKKYIDDRSNELRTIMLAYYYDKLSEEKIAESLSISVGEVRGRLYSAQSKLESYLQSKGYDVSTINQVTLSLAIDSLMKQYTNIPESRSEKVLSRICKDLGWSIGNLVAPQVQNERREVAKSMRPTQPTRLTQPTKKPKKKNGLLIVLIVLLSIFLLLGVTWVVLEQMDYDVWSIITGESADDDEDEDYEDDDEDVESEKESEEDEDSQSSSKKDDEEAEEEKEESVKEEKEELIQNSEYIFPHSSARYLTEAEVASLPPELLPFARNEIIARNGRIFTNEIYKTYFEGKTWYRGTVEPEVFDANYEGYLSEIEKTNIELIKEYEALNTNN